MRRKRIIITVSALLFFFIVVTMLFLHRKSTSCQAVENIFDRIEDLNDTTSTNLNNEELTEFFKKNEKVNFKEVISLMGMPDVIEKRYSPLLIMVMPTSKCTGFYFHYFKTNTFVLFDTEGVVTSCKVRLERDQSETGEANYKILF